MIRKIPFPGTPVEVYGLTRRAGRPSVLLESARAGATGRYSMVCADPFLVFRTQNAETTLTSGGRTTRLSGDPIRELQKLLRRYARPPKSSLPFEGGAIGFFSYEAGRYFEPKMKFLKEKAALPDLYFMFFDSGLVWDHLKNETCIFGNRHFEHIEESDIKKKNTRTESLGGGITNSFSKAQFVEAVEKIKKHISRGDVYQVNLAQRFEFDLQSDPFEIYERLREINPSPFFGYLDAGDFQILSGSPERLVRLEGDRLETRPIAGTRPRGRATGREDKKIRAELLLSEKERAEHIMLVDLERNDLGRVCQPGSVKVDELMATEDYSHVKHIVSNVSGRLKKGLSGLDAVSAVFPGGTITGTPKIRCMEIISKLEPVARGPYTGSMGYFAFTGDMDWNIIIRSLVVQNKKATLHAGAGIVADSDPRKEYAETLHKAEAALAAVFGVSAARRYVRSLISRA